MCDELCSFNVGPTKSPIWYLCISCHTNTIKTLNTNTVLTISSYVVAVWYQTILSTLRNVILTNSGTASENVNIKIFPWNLRVLKQIPIHHTGKIMQWLPCQRTNLEEYGLMNHKNPIKAADITKTKLSKTKHFPYSMSYTSYPHLTSNLKLATLSESNVNSKIAPIFTFCKVI